MEGRHGEGRGGGTGRSIAALPASQNSHPGPYGVLRDEFQEAGDACECVSGGYGRDRASCDSVGQSGAGFSDGG